MFHIWYLIYLHDGDVVSLSMQNYKEDSKYLQEALNFNYNYKKKKKWNFDKKS